MNIEVPHLRKWSAQVKRDIATGTAYLAWVYLKAIMQAAVEDKRLYANPCKGSKSINPPKKPEPKSRAWPKDRVAVVHSALPERCRIALDLGFGCGLRQGEVFAFSPGDARGSAVHIVRQIVRYRSQFYFAPPKGGKEREVPLSPVLESPLAEYQGLFPPVRITLPWLDPDKPDLAREERRLETVPLLITTIRRGALNRNTFNSKTWKPALAAAGVIARTSDADRAKHGVGPYEPSREHGFHILRHTYASVVLQAGESIVSLSQWLGHSDPAFTLRTYTHFVPEAGVRGLRAIEQWFSLAA